MKPVIALVKKDLLSLMPLVLLGLVVFLAQPLIAGLDMEAMAGDSQFWVMAQTNVYWLAYFTAMLLMVSVLQLDPARSLTHDGLTRPVGHGHWLLARLLFLLLTVALPVVLGRFLVLVQTDLGFVDSVRNALAVEKLPAVLPVPLLFAAALLTSGLKKLVSLLVTVLLILLIPAWSVTRPLLNLLGIDIGQEFDALGWVQAIPLLLAGVLASVLVYYFLYCRRRLAAAQWAFAAGVAMVFLTLYPPAWLYNWDRAIALNAMRVNAEEETLGAQIFLDPVQACFPAEAVHGVSGQGGESLVLARAAWPELVTNAAVPGSVSFATTTRVRDTLREWIQPGLTARPLSVKWRADRIRTRAWYLSDSLSAPLALERSSTAENRFAPIAGTDTDYWMLPGDAREALAADPSTRLRIEYDLALLEPKTFALATDGVRRRIPELGSCKANHEQARNRIRIECIKQGAQPALVSAELPGIEGSRVDSASRAGFTPAWMAAIGRRRYELDIEPASLIQTDSILISAWEVRALLSKQIETEGLLGAALTTCPLPDSGQDFALEQASWQDSSPHQTRSVAVEPGVRVEVLDWRNGDHPQAPTLLLLHGLGATAHSYDQLAVRLGERYNVIGMTRRGVGESSKPDGGYDIARLGQDVLQVIETLGLERPVLAGHSIAGEELSYLGAHSPEQFAGLIYLDAAYDRVSLDDTADTQRYQQLNAMLPPAPPVLPSEAQSYRSLQQARRSGDRALLPPEGEIMASYDLGTGNLRHDTRYLDAMTMGLQAPDYPRIALPALALYAMPTSPEALMEPWYDGNDPAVQQAVQALYEIDRRRKQSAMSVFDAQVPDSQVLAIDDASHWIFVSHEEAVLKAMEAFIDGHAMPGEEP